MDVPPPHHPMLDLQSRQQCVVPVGFLDLSSKFPSPSLSTPQPPPPLLQHIHNDLNKTICVPFTSSSSSIGNADWFSDFVTDVCHDTATRRVAVASAVPYIPLPSLAHQQADYQSFLHSFLQQQQQPQPQQQYHFNTQTLLDEFARFHTAQHQTSQQQSHSNHFSDDDKGSVLITTPQPTITVFEHSNNEWRVQSILPRGHIGNIYKVDWCDPEFGTFIAACSDDGLVHVYEEVVLDQQTTTIINDNQLLSDTSLLHPLHNHIAVIQAQQAAAAAPKQTHPSTTEAESTLLSSSSPFLTQHQYPNAASFHNQQGFGKKKDELRAQLAPTSPSPSTPMLPTPSALLQQSTNPQPTTATASSVPSLLEHSLTKPPPTTWIRTCSFQTGLDPVVYLEWAPRHLGMRLATCCLDGKLRIYDLQTNDEHELAVANYDCYSCAWNRSPWDTPMILTVGDIYAQVYEYSDKGSRWYRQCVLPGHVDTLTACAWAPSYGRAFHIVATGDRSGIVRVFKFFPRGFDGSGTGAVAELLSLLIPYQHHNFHFQTHDNFGTTQILTSSFHKLDSTQPNPLISNAKTNTSANSNDITEINTKLLFRGHKDKLTPVPNDHNASNASSQFVIDSFLGAGFSISRLSFDPTGQLLSVVDDSGTTTIFTVGDNGFWVPYYTPTLDDVIEENQPVIQDDVNPYQFLLHQQQLQIAHEAQFIQSLQQQPTQQQPTQQPQHYGVFQTQRQ